LNLQTWVRKGSMLPLDHRSHKLDFVAYNFCVPRVKIVL